MEGLGDDQGVVPHGVELVQHQRVGRRQVFHRLSGDSRSRACVRVLSTYGRDGCRHERASECACVRVCMCECFVSALASRNRPIAEYPRGHDPPWPSPPSIGESTGVENNTRGSENRPKGTPAPRRAAPPPAPAPVPVPPRRLPALSHKSTSPLHMHERTAPRHRLDATHHAGVENP